MYCWVHVNVSSPGLKTIENTWAMKKKIAEREPPSTIDLEQKIKTVWVSEITQEYCRKLCHSMPFPIEQVLKNKGHPTKY